MQDFFIFHRKRDLTDITLYAIFVCFKLLIFQTLLIDSNRFIYVKVESQVGRSIDGCNRMLLILKHLEKMVFSNETS